MSDMKKIYVVAGGVAFVILAVALVWRQVRIDSYNSALNTAEETDKITVATTFYPLAHFTKQVGGERVEVYSVVPLGVEPHDYEPTPQDIIRIQNSEAFILNGAGFDPWAEDVATELVRRNISALDMYAALGFESNEPADEPVAEESEDDGHGHETNGTDPHIWLDPVLARVQVEKIRDLLASIDLEHADEYRTRAAAYAEELNKLHQAYERGLATCSREEIVASHNAFGYIASRYGFNVHAISGLSPHDEPSPARLAELADLVEEENIKYIYFETLASPKIAETLVRETGAMPLVLNPIEGLTESQASQGVTYDTLMRDNLAQLQKGLECTQ